MPRDVVIGLDLATRAGWSVLDLEGRRLGSGTWSLAPRKGRSKADRWVRLRSALVQLLGCYDGRVAAIAVERPFEGAARPGAKHAASTPTVAWGLVAIAELVAQVRGIAVVKLPPSRVKKAATGDGRASKAKVAAHMSKRFGLQLEAGDQADALAVGVTSLAVLDVEALRCGEVVEIVAPKKRGRGRHMGFSLTTAQVLARTKTVTRRLGWLKAKPGDRIIAVEKSMGLRKGQQRVKLADLEIVSVRRERLDAITKADVTAEGFPEMTPAQFVEFFCKQKPRSLSGATEVTRIEFRYVDGAA